ncbi:hypothetical protein FNV43_RR14994 [Rhamnella rubrinervis]|uniref:Ubiquitin-like protease family profile domain-containing protein n=1 Tax=Rhamnella rubrinervis TaxID=2594499 RepID=A0A8K0H447_9ROSA|nr:hypothetical protein FNV43_RR14994 [Rhamnella rubrinervis]
MLPNVHEMPLITTVHHAGGQKPFDIAPVVEDKTNVDVDTDRVHPVSAKPGAKMRDAVKRERRHSSPSAYTHTASARQSSPIASSIGADTPDAYRRHSAPSSRTATESTSVEVRLCAMEEKLSIMDRRISSMDSRLSSMDSRQFPMDSRLFSMESKLDCLIKLFSSVYNTTGVQCFDEVGGEGIGMGDAYRTCDQRIDHAANHLVPPVSISSSLIAESEHNVKIFTQMSDRKLVGGRRKRKAARTIESPYNCQSLRRKMIRTLPVSGSVTFDPYRPVPDEVARQYAHFMDTSGNDQTVELFWINVGKDYFRDIECSPKWLTSDVNIGIVQFEGEVLLPLNRDNNHWLLGDIDLHAQHMTLYNCRKHRQTDQLYQVNHYRRLMPMLPYLLHAAGFFASRSNISDAMNEFGISLALDCPQQKIDGDCGVFMRKYIEFLMAGRELNFTANDIVQFRKKNAHEIYAKELSV